MELVEHRSHGGLLTWFASEFWFRQILLLSEYMLVIIGYQSGLGYVVFEIE